MQTSIGGICTPSAFGKYLLSKFAEVAELADALASGASVHKDMGVRISPSAQLLKRFPPKADPPLADKSSRGHKIIKK